MFSQLGNDKKGKDENIKRENFSHKSKVHRHIVVDIMKNGLLQEETIFGGGKRKR